MIAKTSKFPMRREFNLWKKSAKITNSPSLLLHTQKSDNPQVAVIISKKKVKLATDRSALRRLLLDTLLPLAQARRVDAVLFIKKTAPTDALVQEMTTLLK
jgi:ribonuclease P protein component